MDNCKKAQACITDAVDNRLGEVDRNFFKNHIDECPSCRNDFELDVLTKNFVKQKLSRQSTPGSVALLIKQEIEKQAAGELRSAGFFATYRYARAAILAMMVIGTAFVIYLFNSPDLQNTVQAADIMDQSIENYGLFLAGTIRPQQIGQSVDDLREYFQERVNFPVALKPVKECEWVGGVLSDYDGLPLAHLVYKMPAGIVYVYQANWNDVRKGNKISLSNGALESLSQTGWYVNDSHEEYSVVMWLYNDKTVCTAVSSMEETKLKELFSTDIQY
jgi:anti-sigma factor RsiW